MASTRVLMDKRDMFSNRHLVVALLVAPVLAILAWFAVGALFGDKPIPAVPGQAYPLVERSNCRYDSGQCDLRNEDMRLRMTMVNGASGHVIVLTSDSPLIGAMLAIGSPDEALLPSAMSPAGQSGQRWTLGVASVPGGEQRLHLVVHTAGSHWFGETGTAFLQVYREAILQ